MHIIAEIQAMRRKDMDKKEKFGLMAQDLRENEEFRRYIIESLALTIGRIAPGGDDAVKGDGSRRLDADADAVKIQQEAERERQQARARGQGGRGTPNMPRDQRQQ
jgi:peptide-N4-(N-acetyl-beta-glucosaminyl)asparagine amidase